MKKSNSLSGFKSAIRLMGRKGAIYIACILGYGVVELVGTAFYTFGLRDAINSLGVKQIDMFMTAMLFILLSKVVDWVSTPVFSYFCDYASKDAIRDTKISLIDKILHLPTSELDQKPKGFWLSALTNDIACLQQLYDGNLSRLLSCVITGIGGVVLMALVDWRFALFMFSLGLLSIAVSQYFGKRLKENGEKMQANLAKVSGDIYELIKAAKTIRLLRLGEDRYKQIDERTKEESSIRTAGGKLSALMNSLLSVTSAFSYIVILIVGAIFVHFEWSTWSNIIALIGLRGTTDYLFVQFGQRLANVQTDSAGVNRLQDIQALAVEQSKVGSFVERKGGCPLSLRRVSFSYGENLVLQDFSMDVEDVGITALIGESGSGKSTVIKLILGFYNPQSGEIVWNGMGPGTIESIRAKTAYVPQEPMLLRSSIYDNIAFGQPSVTKKTVMEAARCAGAHDFIKNMENGYDTILLDDGKGLSGGQKQRIAIARALAKNADILLLDEITSALDKETADLILSTVVEIGKEKPIVFISHDPYLQVLAHRVYSLS